MRPSPSLNGSALPLERLRCLCLDVRLRQQQARISRRGATEPLCNVGLPVHPMEVGLKLNGACGCRCSFCRSCHLPPHRTSSEVACGVGSRGASGARPWPETMQLLSALGKRGSVNTVSAAPSQTARPQHAGLHSGAEIVGPAQRSELQSIGSGSHNDGGARPLGSLISKGPASLPQRRGSDDRGT